MSVAAVGAAASLKVALYPWVPQPERFRHIIAKAWHAKHPDVSLEWAGEEWDGGYKSDPHPSYDVFVFDALNLGYFQEQGALLPLTKSQVRDYEDLSAFAKAGVTEGEQVLAIPQLGCGSFLFYRADDTLFDSVSTAEQLAEVLGSCSYYCESPVGQTGLMLDLAGGTTAAATYLEGLAGTSGKFPSSLPTKVDPATAATMQKLVATSSFRNILYDAAPYQRATWFGQGHGRAYVGFTESMSQLDERTRSSIRFKPMTWSDRADAVKTPLFYADVVGVSPKTLERGTSALAIELANLMTESATIVAIFGSSESEGAQYLMPVRESAFATLAAADPVYLRLKEVLQKVHPTLFNLGAASRQWLQTMKGILQSVMLAAPKCYCDRPTLQPLENDAGAQKKCPAVCGSRGWNGQWTSRDGSSTCGCNGACSGGNGPGASDGRGNLGARHAPSP